MDTMTAYVQSLSDADLLALAARNLVTAQAQAVAAEMDRRYRETVRAMNAARSADADRIEQTPNGLHSRPTSGANIMQALLSRRQRISLAIQDLGGEVPAWEDC